MNRAERRAGKQVLLLPGEMMEPRITWVIYDHPTDMPEVFVARAWLIRGVSLYPTEQTMIDTDIEAIRDQLRAKGLTRIKEGGPDPVVIESWL